MSKKTISALAEETKASFGAFLDAVAEAIGSGAVEFAAPTKPEVGSYSRDELEEMGVKELRDLAKRHGLDTIKKVEIIDALASDEDADEDEADDEDFEEVESDEDDDSDEDSDEEDDDDDDDEADEDGDEEEEWDRESLEELTLKELREIAREEYDASEIKGLDQDALIDLILGEEDEDEDGDEDDEDEADEDDEDGDEEVLDEESLNAMSLAELKEVASDLDITLPRGAKKPAIIEAILDSGEDED